MGDVQRLAALWDDRLRQREGGQPIALRIAQGEFEHGEAGFFVARSDGRITGRISAARDRLHDEFHGDPEYKFRGTNSEWGIDPGDYEQRALISNLEIFGGDGNDSLDGGAGNDELYGDDGDDKPNKKQYDPRSWLRSGETSFVTRLEQAFHELNNVGTLA